MVFSETLTVLAEKDGLYSLTGKILTRTVTCVKIDDY